MEVIILALDEKADLVIMDDNTAKKTAKFLGLNVTGTLGVLVKAKREGIIKEIAPPIEFINRKRFLCRRENKGNGFE